VEVSRGRNRRGESMPKKVIIIGAGIAGLSAGCYLQLNGYKTEIFELGSTPGGLCTSWKKKDYTIDGCIHWLVGSNPSNNFYHLWNELIDMKMLTFVPHEEYMRLEDRDGSSLSVFTNLDRLEKELLEKAPEDKDLIVDFVKAARKLLRFQMPIEQAPETYNFVDGLKLMFKFLPYFRTFRKWQAISLGDLAAKCKSPLLKKTFELAFLPETSAVFFLLTLAWMHLGSAGYPVGGSLNFARLMEKRYLQWGGWVHYKSRVNKIIVEGGSAKGVVLENGHVHPADIVVSAADGHSTLFEMLEGKYADQILRDFYTDNETFPSYVQVSLGVRRTFDDSPHSLCFPIDPALRIDEESQHEDIGVRIFNFDPTLAPPGKTLITALFTTRSYKYWVDLREKNRDRYRAEKDRIAREVVEALEKKFGHIKENVEVTDVSTPATVIRYTNNWKGSLEGWLLTPKLGMKLMKKTLPGLKNFYLVGQWVEPGGGLPPALLSGRNVTQLICKKDGKKFATKNLAM
jgi:phytoene dehydrogenase-like protein